MFDSSASIWAENLSEKNKRGRADEGEGGAEPVLNSLLSVSKDAPLPLPKFFSLEMMEEINNFFFAITEKKCLKALNSRYFWKML